jgi:uncharacterized membrane protein (DUF485 family)
LASRYRGHGRHEDAEVFAQLLLYVDMPAFMAFLLLIAFVETNKLSGYSTHWSAAFVAGVSAFNLLFVGSSVLLRKSAARYERP